MPLRDYQLIGINKLASKFAMGILRILFQLATGGGKTYMFAGLVDRYLSRQQKRVLILVHREELLQQAYSTLFKGYGIVGAPVTADTNYLPNVMVYIAMVETANNRLKTNPKYFGNIGLVIVDEAHVGNFRKLYQYFPESLIIGFTATPISSSKKDPLKNHFQDIVCGIDIPELIELWKKDHTQGLVPNKTYHIRNINRKDLKIKNGEFDEQEMARTFSSTKHVQNCVAAYQQFGKGEKTIIFNCNIEHSKKVRDAFAAFGYPVRHLDGEMEKKERRELLHWFKVTPGAILCNVGVLTAGFDEPSIINVITNFSTLSLPKWLQTTGRGSRPFPEKTFFNIIDLGGNAFFHGDWSEPRDWADMFFNPDKPRETKGEAPVKECISCSVVMPLSQKICKHCGAMNVQTQKYDDDIVVLELLNHKAPIEINVEDLVAEYAGKTKADGTPWNQIAAVHEMRRLIIAHVKYKWRLKKIDHKTAYMLLRIYRDYIRQWCKLKEKKFNWYMESNSKEWLFADLKTIFKYEPENQVA